MKLPLLMFCITPTLMSMELRVNGRLREADAPYFQIQPGHENLLEAKNTAFAGGTARLETLYPDGQRHVQTATVDTTGHFAFQLGRFATPPRYEYIAGDVLRFGTRFHLTLTAGTTQQCLQFYQGPARQEKSEALWIGNQDGYRHNTDSAVVACRHVAALEWSRQPDGRLTATLPPLPPSTRASMPAGWAPVVRLRGIIGEFVLYWDGEPLGRGFPKPQMLFPMDIPLPTLVDFSQTHSLELRPASDELKLARGSAVVYIPADRIPLASQDTPPCYVSGSAPWRMDYRKDRGRQMNPPYQFSLSSEVLENQDNVIILLRNDPNLVLPETPARIEVRRLPENTTMVQPIALTIRDKRQRIQLDTNAWPAGDYEIALRVPTACGCEEGPTLRYHRAEPQPEGSFAVTPYAPWRLMRDATRDEVIIDDFAKEQSEQRLALEKPAFWTVGQDLRAQGDINAGLALLQPQLAAGPYAVWVRATPPAGAIMYIQLGKAGSMRPVLDSDDNFPTGRDQFLGLMDGTDPQVAFAQFGLPDRGIAALRFTPVTRDSVTVFRQQVETPPCPLGGICDWLDAFVHAPRMEKDVWDNLAASHRDIGIGEIQWALGRSTLLYHSKLPDATRFPARETPEKPVHLRYWQAIMQKFNALAEITAVAPRRNVVIAPWLTMNRHYGEGGGDVFDSLWFKQHPEWHEHRKHNPTVTDNTRSCFFFPEVRKERIDILMEVVRNYPVDRLVLGGCRQQPMLAYHPDMVRAYKELTGIDPEQLDASQESAYLAWVGWRAGFFTQVLRELKAQLVEFESKSSRKILVIMRMPAADRRYSLAQGFDVETWLQEKLVDRLELEGAEDFGGRSSMAVTPFVELGRRYGIPVWGGVNSNTLRAPEWSPAAAMRRALAQYDAGVSGLQIYESNNWNYQRPMRWFLPLLGNPPLMRKMLAESNLEAVWPTVSTNCFTGIDNHSTFDAPAPRSYDIFESGRHEL